MNAQSVITGIFKSFLHFVLRLFLFVIWVVIKVAATILNRAQIGIEAYLQKANANTNAK